MDGLLGNLFGIEEEDPLLAMLPPEQRARLQQQARGQGMTNLGLALLQAGGPSRTPTGIGSRLGQAGMQAMQANQGVMDRNLERMLAARKMQQEQTELQRREKFRQAIPGLFTTQTVTPPVVDEQGRPGAGEVRPPVTTTGFDQNAAMRLAMEYPELAKDYFAGISSVRDMFKTERKTATVGNTIVDVNTGDVIYTAPTEAKARNLKEVDAGNKILLVDSATGETVKEIPKGLAPKAAEQVSYTTQYDANGNLFYIPSKPGNPVLDAKGRPTDAFVPAKAGQAAAAKEARRGAFEDTAKVVLGKVDSALSKVGGFTAGWGGLLANVPGTKARSLQADIDTIKANLGFAELAKMREQSPTGGALGQVAVKEISFLQSTIANLDQLQDPQSLRKSLNEIKASYNRWLDAVKKGEQGSAPSEGNTVDFGSLK
jgi:hypothetical protein